MKTLVKKDIKVVGLLMNLILIPIAFILVLIISFFDDIFLVFSFYIAIILLMLSLVYRIINLHDYHFKSNILINSLPLDRKIIVASRYMTIMMYLIYISIIVFTMSYSFRNSFSTIPIYEIGINQLISIMSVVILLISIYLPFSYYKAAKEDNHNDLTFFLIWSFIIFSSYSYLNRNSLYISINNLDLSRLPNIYIIFSILTYFISLHFSIKIYKAQEF